MIYRVTSYVRTLLRRREHWWAEMWSGVVLMGFGIYSLLLPARHLEHMAVTANFMDLVPNVVWQVAMIAIGGCQILALAIDRRGPRATGALASVVLYAWITLSILIYGYGQQPVFVFPAAWVVVNFYAVKRAIGGLR